MNRDERVYRRQRRYRESDSYDPDERRHRDDIAFDPDPRDDEFTNSRFRFDDEVFGRDRRRETGRFPRTNRFGEDRVHYDSYQDDQFRRGYDPTYEDENGVRHPYEHGGRNRWSDDVRSMASRENHAGKGPRGYRRSEERVKDEACEILARDFFLDASEIEVELKDQVLTLKGEVGSREDKRRAEDLVAEIPGVADVQNQLRVKATPAEGWIPGLGNIDESLGG
jgi:hypothetical protein